MFSLELQQLVEHQLHRVQNASMSLIVVEYGSLPAPVFGLLDWRANEEM